MRLLDKFTIGRVRCLVWNTAEQIPDTAGIALLLSGRYGVGADRLIVLAPGGAQATRCFGADGTPRPVDALARRAAALTLVRTGQAMAAAALWRDDGESSQTAIEYSEVRLTDSFFLRLTASRRRMKIAG